ncbi:MAG: exodeoxyribonuclease subunit beta, partial [Pseudomonadota bacterium]
VAGRVAARLQDLKERRGAVGFADMQHRLLQALEGPRGAVLREHILARYPAALVDEFQDTSPIQYAILDRVYRVSAHPPEHLLLLIGDPKQSIYAFRGADIHSYLRAKSDTAGRHHVLGTNFRSTEAVVSAVNHLFARAEEQAPMGAFGFGPSGRSPLPFVPVVAKGLTDVWVGTAGPQPPLQWAHDPTLRAQGDVRQVYAQHCAERIVGWLNDPGNGFAREGGGFVRLRPQDIAVLVRTGQEAEAVRGALRERGVQSVYLSDKDSVLASGEARDLVYWLAAVCDPQDPARVRAALALGTVGWPLPALADLLGHDEDYDDLVAQLTGLHQVWRDQGVLAMLRQTLHRLGLAASWVQAPGGERRLTNVMHLAELLQTASAELDGEQALVRWLQDRVDDPTTGGDEPLVRLESDADLVQVVTVYKSKGLEYPVVCVPFATSYRPPDKHKGWWAVRLPGADGGYTPILQHHPDVEERVVQERLREDTRLLYVALTRARHGVWAGFAALRNGPAQVCETHLGAAGYLVGGGQALEAGAWRPALEGQWAGGAVVLDLPGDAAEGPGGQLQPTRLHRPEAGAALREPGVYTAAFDRRWGIASYSRLTRDLQASAPVLAPWARIRDDDDATDPSAIHSPTVPSPSLMHTFRRGPVAGQFLHDQLEWLAGEGWALNRDARVATRLMARCERAGFGADAPGLVDWLGVVLSTPLPGLGVALQDLPRPLAELEFWLPWTGLSTAQLDAVCHAHCVLGVPRPVLRASDLHGMLMGFADLVFEHGGRYWVLDYKSNHLGDTDADYHRDALEAAMAQHRYDVQATVYLLALHRLLQSRLGAAYDPATHLGGAVYLFVRGVRGPCAGVSLWPATTAWVQDLDGLLTDTGGLT